MKTAYVFPGQGSQSRGMGKDLFDRYPRQVEQASDLLGYSLRALCLEDPESKLGLTAYTQPALYCVCTLAYQRHLEETGRRPDFLAGHSLGEYAALFAAGAFDFLTGLRLVHKRGELMGRVSGGGMAAVIGLLPFEVRQVLETQGLNQLDVANFNAYDQTVVAGPRAELERAGPLFAAAGAQRVVILNVSAPFHSRYLADVEKAFADFLVHLPLAALQVPVISNYSALPHATEDLRDHLARQITHPVRWIESIEYLLRQGVTEFVELGPGQVLSQLIQKIRRHTAFAG